MESNELKHYGILGMKWGVRRSKAQLRRASGNTAPRKVTKEEYENRKENAIKSGDAKKVKAWKNHLSNRELQEAINRIDLTQRLDEAEKRGTKTGLDKVEDAMKVVGRVTNIVGTGLAAYGTVAKINNTFNNKQLPTIDGTYYKKREEEAKTKADRETAKEAREAAKEAREAKTASDTAEITKLASEGKYDDIIKNYGSYDAQAIKNAKSALDDKSNFESWAKTRKLKEEEKKK